MEITKKDRLFFERVDDTSSLSNFFCGLDSMDDFIHDMKNGLNDYVSLGLTKLWIVRAEDEIVALFALSKNVLILSSDDRQNLNCNGVVINEDIFANKITYPSIEIDYIAVAEKWQKRKIGSFILSEIANKALSDQLSATMFLTVEAIDTESYSAIGFYKKFNFSDSQHGIIRNQSRVINGEINDTRRMYRPIYRSTIV